MNTNSGLSILNYKEKHWEKQRKNALCVTERTEEEDPLYEKYEFNIINYDRIVFKFDILIELLYYS